MTALPDQAAREAVVFERDRNVIVSAGAGSGKTYTLVSRLLELVAPSGADAQPMTLERLAAITFTRRAAGELKLQIRRRLQQDIDSPHTSKARARLLHQALATADQAFIGTIHSFARRLLLARPVESGLGPGFAIVEDTNELKREVFDDLLHHAQAGSLPQRMPPGLEDAAGRLQGLMVALLDGSLAAESLVFAFGKRAGLDAWVSECIEQRDIHLHTKDLPEPVAGPWLDLVEELASAVSELHEDCRAHRILRQAVAELEAAPPEAGALSRLTANLRALQRLRPLRGATQSGEDFAGADPQAWALKKALFDDPFKPAKNPSKNKAFAGRRLRQELCGDLFAWAAHGLQACAPVVLSLYEERKRNQAVLDQTDLLLKLRDALLNREAFRRSSQAMFDHILVDECQDTDPLQIEILALLAAGESAERDWRRLPLRPGVLTIVGDPKQSIYRFRRADIKAYRNFLDLLEGNGSISRRLSCNFRSRPELVRDVFNARGPDLLGAQDQEPAPGQAPYEDLQASGKIPPAEGAVCHILRYGPQEKLGADEWRALEGQSIAAYLADALRAAAPPPIRDQDDGNLRPLQARDVAILCRSTSGLAPLCRALDALELPYVLRGGSAALSDPLLARFFLGLHALADAEDGHAEAALLGPPFFNLSPDDTLASSPAWARAHSWLEETRCQATALGVEALIQRVLEETAFGAWLQAAPNGAQRMSTLLQALAGLQQRADAEGWTLQRSLDELRLWAESAPKFDPAPAEHRQAIRIFTTHQSKGLEFPLVLLWDAMTARVPSNDSACLFSDDDGRRWRLKLDLLEHDSSDGVLASTLKDLELFEKDRLYYVAMTRARDLLVLPLPRGSWHRQSASFHVKLCQDLAPPAAEQRPEEDLEERMPIPETVSEFAAEDAERMMRQAVEAALQGRLQPAAPSHLSHRQEELPASAAAGQDPEAAPPRLELSRHGARFGSLVHRALELWTLGHPAPEALELARAEWDHEALDDAIQDVERSIAALAGAGVRKDDFVLLPEYHLSGQAEGDRYLLAGQIDLVAVGQDRVLIVDYKTDRCPPEGKNPPHYEQQLRLYRQMMQATGLTGARRVELYLLFTETGSLRPVD